MRSRSSGFRENYKADTGLWSPQNYRCRVLGGIFSFSIGSTSRLEAIQLRNRLRAALVFGFVAIRDAPVTSSRVVYPIPLGTPSSRWLSSCLRNSVKHLSTIPVFHFTKFYLNRSVLCWAMEDFCRAIFESSKPLVINWPAPKRKPQSFWGIFFAILNLVVSS